MYACALSYLGSIEGIFLKKRLIVCVFLIDPLSIFLFKVQYFHANSIFLDAIFTFLYLEKHYI